VTFEAARGFDTRDLAKDMDMKTSVWEAVGVGMKIAEKVHHWDAVGMGIGAWVYCYRCDMMESEGIAVVCCGVVVVDRGAVGRMN
jgi:hypothetical protein